MTISAAEYLRRVKTVNKKTVLQNMAFEVIMEKENDVRLLKKEDFLEGDIYGIGVKVPYKSRGYEEYKRSKNPLAGGSVDLILSGDFVHAMSVKKLQQNRYTFDNSDWKKNILSKQYGKEIFGLNQYEFNKYQNEVLSPMFIRLIKQTANIA